MYETIITDYRCHGELLLIYQSFFVFLFFGWLSIPLKNINFVHMDSFFFIFFIFFYLFLSFLSFCTNTQSQLTMFTIDQFSIKARISDLIDQEYLERSEDDVNELNYLA